MRGPNVKESTVPIPHPSLRDFLALTVDPNAEALGYCQMSLRDK